MADNLHVTPVIQSARLISIHVIGSRTYHVFSHSVCCNNVVVLSLAFQVIQSCIIGDTIALLHSNGLVVIPHPSNLVQEDCKYDVCSFMAGFNSNKQIAASSDGSHLIVSVKSQSAYILNYNQAEHSLEKVAILRDMHEENGVGGHVQLSVLDGVFIIWQLYIMKNTPVLSVRRFDPDIESEKGIIAEFPLQIKLNTNRSLKASSMQLIVVEPKNWPSSRPAQLLPHGALIRVDSQVYFISLRSIIIGNLLRGLKLLDGDTYEMCVTRDLGAQSYFIFLWSKNCIFKLDLIDADGNEFELSSVRCKMPYGLFPNELLPSNLKFAVSKIERNDSDTDDTEAQGQSYDYKVTYASKYFGGIREFHLDVRKHPWRVLTLGFNELKITIPAKSMKYSGKVSLKIPISSVIYEKSLDLMLIYTIQGHTRCIFGKGMRLPAEITGRALVCRHIGDQLIIIFTDRIEWYHDTSKKGDEIHNWKLRDTTENDPGNIIFGATIIPEIGILLQHFNKVRVVPFDKNKPSYNLIEGVQIFFLNYNEETKRLVVSTSGPRSDSFKVTEECIDAPKLSYSTGIAYVFNMLKSELAQPEFIFAFKEPPTAFHIFKNNCLLVIFKYNEWVYTFNRDTTKKSKWTLFETYQLYGPLRLGISTSQYAILTGFGLHLITYNGEYRRLYDNSEKSRGYISSISVISDDELLACVLKDEIRFFSCSFFGALHTTDHIFRQVRFPPPVNPEIFKSVTQYHTLLIPSLRVLILYRGSICHFYDSSTLESLLVRGLYISICSNVSLWSFTEGDRKYEQVVFTDGSGSIESYTLKRDGMLVQCSIKYRATAFAVTERFPIFSEIVSFNNRIMYVGRRNELIMLAPIEGKISSRISLKSSVTSLSCVLGKYVIVTDIDTIYIMSPNLHQLYSVSAMDMIGFIDNVSFKCHVSSAFSDVKDGTCRVVIMCSMKGSHDRHFNAIIEFSDEEEIKKSLKYTVLYRNPDNCFRDIKIVPGYEDVHWKVNHTFMVIGVTCDYCIKTLSFPIKSEKSILY